ncbi:26S proteasome regulatory subunit 6A homolog B [Aduncisulcus paluster]|uniref:26S proteasome regulatory subunit 6A homolog B n=1 Tax=Aduncisulcus paluster TaxID=2918883 RepID=A0ABQ5KR07_9EUKA|nr:26S proteasome regulatory subunit 6A homolog B [Aduncisulcus paluster]
MSASEEIPTDVLQMSDSQIQQQIAYLRQEIGFFENNARALKHDIAAKKAEMKDLKKKIKLYRQLPYLVGTVAEILDMPEVQEDKTDISLKDVKEGKCVVVKTTTRHTMFLPVPGLIRSHEIVPGDMVGVNKDSYLILEKLPPEYDTRVTAFEVKEKPKESYTDVGGLDDQIKELREAVVLPMEQPEIFEAVGVKAPKGVLMHGPPGTGKTLLARVCAAQAGATFLKLAASELVQKYIGEGARIVRDTFKLAREKQPAILFIDELDAVGTKRFSSEVSGDREVQRTMLELLNQMDGFSSDDRIKVLAATNRIDVLDPALLRSGRFDRKIEFPLPKLSARMKILKIHSRKMNVSAKVNLKEIAGMCEDFNGAQLKAVCVEGGMIALRRRARIVEHEDYVEAVAQVKSKKVKHLKYFI